MNRMVRRLYVLLPVVMIGTAMAEDIVINEPAIQTGPGSVVVAQFLIQNSSTPLLGYTLDIEVTPQPGASGSVTIDASQSSLFPAQNLISAAGGTTHAQLTTVANLGAQRLLVNAIVDDGLPVTAADGVNDVLAEVAFLISSDASGDFAIELGGATALSDASGFAVGFDGGSGLLSVLCETTADCADTDGNGIRDDGCVWWSCDAGACNGIDVLFADMGGQFGACTPDGTADNNDFNLALNCFSDVDTMQNPGAFPCEPDPPTAFNVDTGGQFGSCFPDGVCDGNDAFAALNAFSGSTTCSCLTGPAPAFPAAPVQVDRTAITLRSHARRVAAGGYVLVDLFLDRPIEDLRGYQLHVGVSGGSRGSMRLIDMSVDTASKGFALGTTAVFSAFNTATQQMVVGTEGPGVDTAGRSYLGTLTFLASADATGKFVIDLLADPNDVAQRTFLFPTQSNGRIDVIYVTPATVEVSRKKKTSVR